VLQGLTDLLKIEAEGREGKDFERVPYFKSCNAENANVE